MSTAFEFATQQIVYAALAGNISATIFDAAPHVSPSDPSSDFPFVMIGESNTDPFDNDTDLGQQVYTNLHIFSRAEGMKECKTIMGEIYAILHRGQFTLAGYVVVDSLIMDTITMTEDDGETRHGVISHRLTIQEA